MPRVFIPAQLRDLTGGLVQVETSGRSVREVIATLDIQFPGMQKRLCQGGSLSPALQVSIDGVFSLRGLDARSLYAPGEPDAAARSLVSLAEDPEGRRRLGTAGRDRPRAAFSVAAQAEGTEVVYRSAITARRTGAR